MQSPYYGVILFFKVDVLQWSQSEVDIGTLEQYWNNWFVLIQKVKPLGFHIFGVHRFRRDNNQQDVALI